MVDARCLVLCLLLLGAATPAVGQDPEAEPDEQTAEETRSESPTPRQAPAFPDSLVDAAADLDEVYPWLDDLSCRELDPFAWEAAPAFVYGDRPDLLYQLVVYWEEACGTIESLVRLQLLSAIWDDAFNESLYGPEITDWLAEYAEMRGDAGRGKLRLAFDTFTVAFADQLLPHVADRSPEQFFCLYYSDRLDEAWALLESADLEDTWLRFYRDDELFRMAADARPVSVAVTTGYWRPRGAVALAGDHALLGVMAEQLHGVRFARAVFEVRLGRTQRPYDVDNGEIAGRSDRFDAMYLGLEAGWTLVHGKRHRLDLFGGLGVDAIVPFLKESVVLGTLNGNLGVGWRLRPDPDQPWFVAVDGRREWLAERNEGVDPLSGGAWSVRVGLGWVFDGGLAQRRALLGR